MSSVFVFLSDEYAHTNVGRRVRQVLRRTSCAAKKNACVNFFSRQLQLPCANAFDMLLYNETIGIDRDIEPVWLQWIQENYIPAAMNTGLFVEYKIFKILQDEEETISYSIQYFSRSIDHIQEYIEVFAPKLMEEHRVKFLNKHVVFRTLLEQV